ncbi:MAG: glutamine amidotransferase [Azonexus sp.]
MPTDLSPALYIVKTGDTLPPLRERHGDFEDWIERGLAGQGLPVRTIDPRRTLEWPARERIAGVVVSGSPAMVTDRAAWSERTAAWLAQLVREEVPALGICYGHQLLAHALGGTVGPHPRGIEIGTVRIECTRMVQDDPLFGALPAQFKAQVVHEQTVLRLPPGATVLARNAHEPHHAFRVGRCAWGVQFHPEFNRAVMQGYLDLRREESSAAAESAMAEESPAAAALLPRFARWVQE